MTTSTIRLGDVDLTLDDQGSGRPVLLLHGGAGPQSVTDFAALLADRHGLRVLTPTHPGFGGTARPDGLASVADLARLYVDLLDLLDLDDVLVVGNSVGGWTAAEIALRQSPHVGRVVLVDAVGLELPEHPVVDFFSLTMAQVAELSWFDPAGRVLDVAALPAPARALMAGNRAALQAYGGTTMTDPGLLGRLPAVDVETVVVWGVADRVVTPEHGAAYAAAIPGARLEILERAGHLPQLEQPAALAELVVG